MSNPNVYHPSDAFVHQANVSGMTAYTALCKKAEVDYEGFWAEQAHRIISWKTPFSIILNKTNPPFFKWFEDGTLNASYNCLDRNIERGRGNKTALIFESDAGEVRRITYSELLGKTCQIANGLRSIGIKKSDRVIIYISMSVDGIAAMQACARIGAIHSVVFGGFSAQSLRDRIEDTGAVAVITADYQMRGGKCLPLKAIVDEAIALGGCESVQNVLIVKRTNEAIVMHQGRDQWMSTVCEHQPLTCEPEWVHSEHPLFLLYTSGSTGKPKGVQHSTGGYLLHAALTTEWTFDLKEGDIFWCTADIGWVTGHTYGAYGPLALGATQVVFEGIPTYPDSGRFWKMIQDHQVTIFYTAPTAIRSLIKASGTHDAAHPKRYNLSSLRLLGSVGEPINPAAWEWYYKNVGHDRCPIVDTFWQTETGGHVITPLPGATPLVPGSCTLAFPGIDAAIVDEVGQDCPNGQAGILVIKKPWPSMIRTIWGDPERFKQSYYPDTFQGKYYLAGDGAVRDEHSGYFTITGRIDDVLNISGHRLGTMEIESALVSCTELVAEAAVVGRPDDTKGEAVCAFVVLKQPRPVGEEAKRIAEILRNHVAKEIGPIAKPTDIRFGDNLPKTRSGKIMRRLLRSLAKNEAITQDISTLENPAILDQLMDNH